MSRPSSPRLLLLVTLLSGCIAPESPTTPTGYWTSIDDSALELSLHRGDTPLLRFAADGLQLGVVPELDDTRSYDPFFLAEQIDWQLPGAITLHDAEEGTLAATVEFEDGTLADLTVTEQGEGRFEATLLPAPGSPPIGFYRLVARADATEGFYGLGGVLDTPNHRGKTRAMQLEPDLGVESANNEAHVPVPFLIGTTGWGLFVQDSHPMLFEVATRRDDLVQVTVGTGMDSADGLRFHLYGADHPLDVTRRYYDTTGDPLLPARWALGPWIWRDENEDQAQVESDLTTIRELDLATSGYWIDRPYASGVNSFDFSPEMFHDAPAMIELAHSLGFRMALWHTPYVDPVDAPEIYAMAEQGDWFAPRSPPVFNNWSSPIDLTNPDAYSGWQELIRRYTDLGIEGFKLDYAEDVVLGLAGGRLPWEFADGSDERTMHAEYQRLYHRVYAETMPKSGGFLLCRAGTWGDQTNVSVIWPGDLDATLNLHGAEAEDDGESYVATGGLPASVVYGLSLGPSGFPFYGSDTGGYRHASPNRETFTRWFQQTALSTVMQVGTNANDVPWEFREQNGFDAEMLDWYREFARLHLRLFPYEWTYAEALARDGRPIARPYGLAYPESGLHPADTYLFGDHLLVAPVMEAGATTRDVPFPGGRWVDWFTGEWFEGEGTRTVDAPLDKLPLYLAAGGIVPLLRPTIDTTAPVADPDQIDSFAERAGVLYPRVAPGPHSRFVVYDGAVIEQRLSGGVLQLLWQDGDEFVEGALFEVVGLAGRPERVSLNGDALEELDSEALDDAPRGWAWTEDVGGMLRVRLPSGGGRVAVQ